MKNNRSSWGVLRIHLESNFFKGMGNPKMEAYVSVSDLKSLEVSGGNDIYLKNPITAGEQRYLHYIFLLLSACITVFRKAFLKFRLIGIFFPRMTSSEPEIKSI